MGKPVVDGAVMACSFGSAPSKLVVLPANRVQAENKPMANVNDFKPYANIKPFGLCASLANPITASQTSAAMGTLTPGTCTPNTTKPWSPGSLTVLVAGAAALDNNCVCNCNYAGVIKISVPGTRKETLG
jgi:uncharacterized protein DUF4280